MVFWLLFLNIINAATTQLILLSFDREGAIDRLVRLYKKCVYKTGVSTNNIAI